MTTADKIKKLREEKKLSQNGLSLLVKTLSQSQICKIENGERRITDTDLLAISRALQVNVEDLIG